MVDEEISLEGPVPMGVVIIDDDEITLLVEFTRTVELEEPPVPRGVDGLAETKLLVSLPYGAPLVALVDRPLEGPVTMGTVMFEVDVSVVNVTDDETVVEEVVLFAVAIFELVENVEDTSEELAEDTVDVVEEILLELLGAEEFPLLEVVEGATLLLLELLGASLILRAPLIPLFVVRFTSLFFM